MVDKIEHLREFDQGHGGQVIRDEEDQEMVCWISLWRTSCLLQQRTSIVFEILV